MYQTKSDSRTEEVADSPPLKRRCSNPVCGCVAHVVCPEENSMFGRCLARFVEFVEREDGPTAVEYAVMLSLIVVVCLAAISLGSNASKTFDTVGQQLVRP